MCSPQKDEHLNYPETSATSEVNVAKVFSMTKYSGFRCLGVTRCAVY